ncbi:hypothetical protein HZS_1614 [Henneguya salminicola]|nr:hypothetical protein HZS_1614 [Henneguya salminicola]
MITVDIDEENQELIGIIDLFGLRVSKHLAQCFGECRINNHYRSSLKDIFDNFPNGQDVFIFEDDLIVSSDVFYYFSSLLHIYHTDTSIFCISAWNDQAYSHSVRDLTMLYRVQFMPGLGLVLSRDIINKLIPMWPSMIKMNWDAWLRESIIKNRVCIIPDASRTFHIGKFGLHSSPAFQIEYFNRRFFQSLINVKINYKDLSKIEYNHLVDYLASHSKTALDSSSICNVADEYHTQDLIANSLSKEQLANITEKVFLYAKDGMNHVTVFKKLFKCFRIWDLDLRGMNNNYFRVWLKNIHYLVIPCPSSYLCKYKPANHKMFK